MPRPKLSRDIIRAIFNVEGLVSVPLVLQVISEMKEHPLTLSQSCPTKYYSFSLSDGDHFMDSVFPDLPNFPVQHVKVFCILRIPSYFVSPKNSPQPRLILRAFEVLQNCNLETTIGSPACVYNLVRRTEVRQAILASDELKLRDLIKSNNGNPKNDIWNESLAEINDEHDSTPFEFACELGHQNIIKLLIDHGLIGDNWLYVICEHSQADGLRWLMDSGVVDLDEKTKSEMLFYACTVGSHEDFCTILIEHGNVSVDSQDEDGRTPLHVACQFGNTNMVKLLIDKWNSNMEILDNYSRTPLFYAVNNGLPEIVNLLLDHNADWKRITDVGIPFFGLVYSPKTEHLNVDLVGWQHLDKTRPTVATKKNYMKKLSMLTTMLNNLHFDVNQTDAWGATMLWYACIQDFSEMAFQLLHNNADVNTGEQLGISVIGATTISANNIDLLQELINKHAEVNKPDMFGRTPLHFACHRRWNEGIFTLLHHNAKVQAQEYKEGATPFQILCATGDSVLIEEFLCWSRALPLFSANCCDFNNRSPLHYACARGDIKVAQVLIEKGKVNLNQPDSEGETPLLLACQNGHSELVKFLIEGCKANLITKRTTLLHEACTRGHTNVVSVLVHNQVPVDQRGREGTTALFEACKLGYFEIVRILVTEGHANTTLCDRDGCLPIEIATKNGHKDITHMLAHTRQNSLKETEAEEGAAKYFFFSN